MRMDKDPFSLFAPVHGDLNSFLCIYNYYYYFLLFELYFRMKLDALTPGKIIVLFSLSLSPPHTRKHTQIRMKLCVLWYFCNYTWYLYVFVCTRFMYDS
jgi:hypothetical protein